MDMYEVKTNYFSKWFGNIDEAEEAYFDLCNQYDYVVIVKHTPGKAPDVRRTSF